MKSCKQCDEYDVCSRQNDLRRKKPRCPKAKTDKPVTHYDLLISKTPEEIAEWLKTVITECSHCPCNETETFCEKTCKELLTDWLKSPVEV